MYINYQLSNRLFVLTCIIVSCAVVFAVYGCEAPQREVKHYDPSGKLLYQERVIGNRYVNLYEVKIDGCDYLWAEAGTGGAGGGTSIALTHKGNCTNPIHVYYKETR
jgi:hypothetical protein